MMKIFHGYGAKGHTRRKSFTPKDLSWGLLIGSSRDYIFDAWWAATLPGLIIFITSLSICLVGDGLTTALNPKLRKL